MSPETARNMIMAASALAASASALFAAFALRLNLKTKRAELEKGRPYFVFINFKWVRPVVQEAFSSQGESLDPFKAQLEGIVKNLGARPAINTEGSLFLLPQTEIPGDPRIPLDFSLSVADELPPGTEWLLATNPLQIHDPENLEPNYYDPGSYVVFAMTYDDPITHKHFTQFSFLRWPGVEHGIMHTNLVAVTRKERETILTTYKSTMGRYLQA